MKILVTGSAGFIGYHLSKSLLNDGFEIMGVDNINDYYDQGLKYARLENLKSYTNFIFKKIDISNMSDLKTLFYSFKPQKVVNLAAQPGVRNSLKNPFAYINSNIVAFMNILELSKETAIDGLIYASSSSVYGDSKDLPFCIEDRVDKQISLYGATKRYNELIAHSYSHLYDINTTGLRYFTVYGPWNRPDMAIFIFTKNILKGQKISLYNNGEMYRDFTYIDDIIRGTRLAIDKNCKCDIFNLGNSKSEKLRDVLALIERELGIKAKIDLKKMQLGEVKETCADIDYSRQKINFEPTTSIKKGIPKFVNWYKEYYNA